MPQAPLQQKSKIPALIIGIGYMIFHYVMMIVIQLIAMLICNADAKSQLGGEAESATIEKLADTLFAENVALINIITQFSVVILVILLYLIIRSASPKDKKPLVKEWFSLKKTDKSILFSSILIAFFSYFVVIGFVNFIGFLFPGLLENYNNSMETEVEINWALQFITLVIGAPLVEELIYRNMAIGSMKKSLSSVISIAVSATVFGLAHGNPLQILYAGALGVVFGLLFVRSESIFPSLIGHAVFNAIGFVFSFLPEIIGNSTTANLILSVILSIFQTVSMVGAPLMIWWFIVKTKRPPKETVPTWGSMPYPYYSYYPQQPFVSYEQNNYVSQYSGNQTYQPYQPYYAPYPPQMPPQYPYQVHPVNQWVYDPARGWILVPIVSAPPPQQPPQTTSLTDEKSGTSE